MYECPRECGSTLFTQIVMQQETVETDGAGGIRHIDVNGSPAAKLVVCDTCGETVIDDSRTFIVHPDGTDEIYNLQRVDEHDLPKFFQQFMLEEHDSWDDAAEMWVFYDATHLDDDEIDRIIQKHNEDYEEILGYRDFIGFSPFIRNSLAGGGSDDRR